MNAFLFPCIFPQPQITCCAIEHVPAALNGLRALFVSDVHLRGCVSDAKLNALIEQIRAQNADLLLLGGDYGEGAGQCARFFEALSALCFPLGAFAVPGNNDDPAVLTEAAQKAGIRLPVNKTAALEIGGVRIEIGGCDDYKYGTPDTRHLFSDAAAYRILLSHFPILPAQKCDLIFSGHTHGGQIRLGGLTAYALPFEKKFEIAAAYGDNVIDGTRLLISNGIGVSKLPIRIGAAPEILLAEFSR